MAQSYTLSAVESANRLGVELQELEDWNCCGATAYFHVDQLLAYTLCARNLAMAEKERLDLVAPCSGCYKNMDFTGNTSKPTRTWPSTSITPWPRTICGSPATAPCTI